MTDPDVRLYGMADSSNHQGAAENGMRGEGAADIEEPAYRREIRPDGQRPIVVAETSGVAFVEARRAAPTGIERLRATPWPWLVGLLAWGYVARTRRRRTIGTA